MFDLVEAGADVSFQEPVKRGPFPANFAQSCMATAVGAEAMTRVVEIRSLWAVVDAFEDEPNDLLHDLIACRRNSQFSHLSICFGDENGPDGLELKVFGAHLLDDLGDHLEREAVERFSVDPRRHISWGGFDPFIGENVDVLLVEEAIEMIVGPFPVGVQLS